MSWEKFDGVQIKRGRPEGKKYDTPLGSLTFGVVRSKARSAIESGRNLFWIGIYNEIAEAVNIDENPYKKTYGKGYHN